MAAQSDLLARIKACTLCADQLPLPPKPILQYSPQSPILIAGQAPGIKAHQHGRPFADVSGQRLRQWLGISEEDFYNPALVSILPMGFCYPGRGKSGDLPPLPQCAQTWRDALMAGFTELKLTLVIGQYAQRYHLPGMTARSVTETVQQWRAFSPAIFPLPHPSPRNQGWLARNPWFAEELLPALQQRVGEVLGAAKFAQKT